MKSPVITVIGSLSFASGCLVVANNLDKLTAGSELVLQHSGGVPNAQTLLASQLSACIALCWPILVLVSITAFALAQVAERRRTAIVFLALPLLSTTYTIVRLPHPQESDLLYSVGQGKVRFVSTIESVKGSTLVCRPIEMKWPEQKPLSGKCLVTVFGVKRRSPFLVGQTIGLYGRIETIRQNNSEWLKDQRRIMVSNGIFSRTQTTQHHVKILKPPQPDSHPPSSVVTKFGNGWQQFWERGRQEIIKAHANSLGAEKGDLLSSMVLGDRVVRLPKELKQLFRSVGLSHLLAASGFNLSIVVASSYFLARMLPIPPYGASLFALSSTASFVFLAGPSPSVVRAAVLCVFFLTARLFCRRLHGLAALSLTLLFATLVDPLCIADIGLQLSYLATAGIISGVQWMDKDKPIVLRQKLLRWLTDTAAVICIAQLSILPIQVICFRTAGLIFLPANLLVDPVVAPVTVLGFISSMVAFSTSFLPFGITCGSFITENIDKLASLSLDYMINCAKILASIEGTTIRLGPPVSVLVPFYYFCFAFFLYSLPRKNMRDLGLIVLLIGLSALMFRPNIPGEVIVLTRECAISLEGKHATNLNKTELDWLSKQLIAYSGCEPIPKTPTKRTLFENINATETSDFTIISAQANEAEQTQEHPLNDNETAKVQQFLRSEKTNLKLPVVLWSYSRRGYLSERQRNDGVYVARVAARRPTILAKNNKSKTRGHFYPFKIRTKVDDVLVLQ